MRNHSEDSVLSDNSESKQMKYESVNDCRENPSESRLYFLYLFTKKMGLTWRGMAMKAGYLSQNINWWLRVDDCRLSVIEKLLAPEGFKIIPSFEKCTEKSSESIQQENCSIKGLDLIPESVQMKGKNRKIRNTFPFLQKYSEESHLLSFVAKALLEEGMGVYELCTKCEIDARMLLKWLNDDDIRISKLYRLAEMLNRKLVWTFERL